MANIIDTKLVKTRKDHCCCGCEKVFKEGSELLRTTYIDDEDNKVHSVYTCDMCREYCADNNISEWEFGEIGELIDDDVEWSEKYLKEHNQ